MLHLLRRNEKESLRSRLLDGLLLYKAFQKPIREFEAEATGFRLSPEEVFWQVVVVLDKVKEYQEDALIDIRGLWDDIYVDYRDLSDDEDGLDLFTAITVFCIQTCLVMLDAPLYRTMTSIIGEQLAKKDQPSQKMEAAVLNNITRIGTDKFKAAVQVYMNSEEDWLSDEIEEVLDKSSDRQTSESIIGDSELQSIANVLRTNSTKNSPVYLTDEKGAKIDIIRVMNVLYELGKFRGKGGAKLTKKEFFITMGKAINVDLSNYDKDLSRSTSDSTKLEKHLRVFDEMKQKMEEIWNSK